TGKILGEYKTAPEGQPINPSRTTVDKNGNVWVANRNGNSVVHIGLEGNGQCVDRNQNGAIDTSSGQGDIRAWTNAGGADTSGGVSTAADECIIHYVRVASTGTRHVSVNADNDVWVSGTGRQGWDLIDGKTGAIKRREPGVGAGGYGGLIDPNGVIWSSTSGSLLRWDTALPLKAGNYSILRGHVSNYGVCIDSKGNIWSPEYGSRTAKYAPDGTLLGVFNHGYGGAQGCAVDRNDHVWVAHSLSGASVGHLKNDGTWVGNVRVPHGPTGVAVDADGKIWSASSSGYGARINPKAGPVGTDGTTLVGAVDYTTPYLGPGPYNYSDMTGSTLSGAPDEGTWTYVYDGGAAGIRWGKVRWSADVPGDAALTVRVASSEDGKAFSAPETATSGTNLTVANGRYLRITVSFSRSGTGESPVLYDLAVAGSNTPPVADDRSVSTDEDAVLDITLAATDADGDSLTYTVVTQPTHGKLSGTAPNLTYTPDSDYSGSDSFTYKANDGTEDSNIATVSIIVRPVNDKPVAKDDLAKTPEDEGLTLTQSDLLANDSDPDNSAAELSVTGVSGAEHGSVELLDSGAVRFAPDANYNGPASFRYTLSDGDLTDTAIVSITVTPVNDKPGARDDAVETDEDTSVLVDVLANDSDVDGDTLVIDRVDQASHGAVEVVDGKVRYTPESNYHGHDSFTYTVSDGNGGTDTATVEITVRPVNDAPKVVAGPDVSTDEGSEVEVTATFTDVEADQSHTCSVTWSDGSKSEGAVTEPEGSEPGKCTASHTYIDDDPTGTPSDAYDVTVQIIDSGMPTESDSAKLAATVRNLAPSITGVTGPTAPLNVDSASATVSADFTDAGSHDAHRCEFGWGDGSEPTEVDATSGRCEALHTYTAPGVYSVMLKVTDDDTGSATAQYEYVVVYDPEGGFVTGGGWIESPEGAYRADPTLTGRASFGFVSKYKTGATVPTGSTEFQFHAAKMNFHSSEYEWLVVSGARAQYKGVGKINNQGSYGFLLTAIDGQISGGGGTDKFRIKIWDRTTGAVVYDNQMDAEDTADPTTVIKGGSIVIHRSR
ncbi:MAG: Ig-like domain-containing protein, partial [Chloroflexota bacterium]|nr:Ig-like domain-containing protein [Chloroflexota bacterium]